MARAAWVVTLALALAACGGDDDSTSFDAAPPVDAEPPIDAAPVTLDDTCAQLVDLFQRLVDCNPAFETVILQGRATPAAITDFCEGVIQPYVLSGTIALPDRAGLAACAAYESTACLDFEVAINSAACDLFRGTLPDDDACDMTEQCSRDSFCDRSGGDPCGVCTARRADGMPCTTDEQCTNGACIGSQCGHLGVDDDPCVIPGAPGADANEDCLGQRACDPDTNHCVTPRDWVVNDVCSAKSLGDCAPFETGLYCSGTGQCTPFLALGADCRVAGAAQGLCNVTRYQTCPAGADAQCTAPHDVTQEGDPCSFATGNRCVGGLVCTNPLTGGTCVDFQAETEVCQPAGQGTDTEHCDLFLGCVDGTCAYGNYTGACPAF